MVGFVEQRLELLVGRRVVERALLIVHAIDEPIAIGRCDIDTEAVQPAPQLSAELLSRHLGSCDTDKREVLRQEAAALQIIDGRHEQAFGQIAGAAKNDERAGEFRGVLVHVIRLRVFARRGHQNRDASPILVCL